MDTNKKFPVVCPSCEAKLTVSELFCEQCETRVQGTFELTPLARLSRKEQAFIVDFVKASGSLKEMAKTMGLSYPTVRNLLDDIIANLSK